MNDKQKEVLSIAREECGEVIVAISKIFRFGFDSRWPEGGVDNRARLTEELGDLMAMVKLMSEHGIIDIEEMSKAGERKITKLKTWSKLYD
jgi:NTP pyrophosphatase (non-canonical NTP hydrolase)